MADELFLSGYASLTGKPNVGKSTLLNNLLGQKIAIVTSRPQTTRNRIIGIKTFKDAQLILIDTPGIHRPLHGLGRHMVKEATSAIADVDIVLFMVNPAMPASDDRAILKLLDSVNKPVFLLINKVDKIRKPDLLPIIEAYRKLYLFDEVIPISAIRGDGVDLVLEHVKKRLKPGPKLYPDDLVTESLERFMVAEIVREKIMKMTSEEVPHSVAVDVTEWKERKNGTVFISANIYIEKATQKGIIIGNKGAKLKEIGSSARLDIESLLGTRIFLELFIKLKKHWRTDKSVLSDMGYK